MSGNYPMTVADLTEEHYGWHIEVLETDSMIGRVQFTLIAVRRWTYEGGERVGLTSSEGREDGWAGTDRHYPADTPCKLLRKDPAYRPSWTRRVTPKPGREQ